jgi:hypothetical protein
MVPRLFGDAGAAATLVLAAPGWSNLQWRRTRAVQRSERKTNSGNLLLEKQPGVLENATGVAP